MAAHRRYWLLLTALVAVLAEPFPVHAEEGDKDYGPMIPVLRFFKHGDEPVIEYIGPTDHRFAKLFANLPVAKGAMQVACENADEVGVVIYPTSPPSWIYGANIKFRYRWRHSAVEEETHYMLYRRREDGFIATHVHPDEWKQPGVIDVAISVGGEVVLTTSFAMQDCDEALYRTPIPPSVLKDQREKSADSDDDTG